MKDLKVWDPVVRMFHWLLVLTFGANALFVDDDSAIHEWIGYTVVALVGLRLIWGLIGSRHARFSDFPPDLSAAREQLLDMASGRVRHHVGHTPLGALMIYNLLLSMLLIGATGFAMTTNTFWGVDWVEELHEACVTWAEISVVLHIAAVIYESRRTGVNLPKSMVTGVKTVPEAASGS